MIQMLVDIWDVMICLCIYYVFEFNVFVEVIMIEGGFRMLENVNEVQNFNLIFVNEIEKLLQFYSYENGRLEMC